MGPGNRDRGVTVFDHSTADHRTLGLWSLPEVREVAWLACRGDVGNDFLRVWRGGVHDVSSSHYHGGFL